MKLLRKLWSSTIEKTYIYWRKHQLLANTVHIMGGVSITLILFRYLGQYYDNLELISWLLFGLFLLMHVYAWFMGSKVKSSL